MSILTELRDPRIEHVTVTRVEVSPDMRLAKVYVSVMGDEAQQDLSLHGLRNSAGFLQRKVGDRIDSRYTPRIRFELDQGVKNAISVSQILDELQQEREDRSREGDSVPQDDDPAEASSAPPTIEPASLETNPEAED